MSYLISLQVLLLAVITLTTVAGNISPKYQPARSNGFISYQPPTIHVPPPPHEYSPPPINYPGTPHIRAQHPLRPPPKM